MYENTDHVGTRIRSTKAQAVVQLAEDTKGNNHSINVVKEEPHGLKRSMMWRCINLQGGGIQLRAGNEQVKDRVNELFSNLQGQRRFFLVHKNWLK